MQRKQGRAYSTIRNLSTCAARLKQHPGEGSSASDHPSPRKRPPLVHTFCMALRMPPVGWVTVSLLRSIVGRPGHSPRLSLSIATDILPRSDLSDRCPARWMCVWSPRTLLVTKASARDGRLAQHAALTPRKATDFKKGLLREGGRGASIAAG